MLHTHERCTLGEKSVAESGIENSLIGWKGIRPFSPKNNNNNRKTQKRKNIFLPNIAKYW